MAMKIATDTNFDTDILNADQTVLVDFWAGHCAPCHQIAPILKDISEDYADKLTVAKIDVADNEKTSAKYGVRAIPTMIIFHKGEAVATQVGALSRAKMLAWIDETLSTCQPKD